jgi:hypothetical protein
MLDRLAVALDFDDGRCNNGTIQRRDGGPAPEPDKEGGQHHEPGDDGTARRRLALGSVAGSR